MATAAPWQCGNCQATNASSHMTCANCGAVRVVNMSAGSSAPGPAPVAVTPRPPWAAPASQPTMPHAAQRPAPLVPPVVSMTPAVTGAQPTAMAPPAAGPDQAPPAQRGVTRYLCCAVQLDAGLAQRAVEEIVEEPRRAVASSPGVDLPVVLAYALAARQRQLARDFVLLVLAFVLLVSLVIFFPLAILIFLIAWMVVAGERFYVSYAVIAPKLSRKNFNPAATPKPHSSHLTRRLADIGTWDTGNVTVCPAFAPFVGYGNPMGDVGTQTIVTDKPKENADRVKPFEIDELYRHVGAAVQNLRLRGLWVQHRLIADGRDLRTELDPATAAALLPDPWQGPVPRAQQQLLRALRQDQTAKARPYLTLQVSGWEGELVATSFLRFYLSAQRDILFLENSLSLLAGVRPAYHSVDTLLDHPTIRQTIQILLSSLVATPVLLLRSIPAVFGAARSAFRRAFGFETRKQVRAIREQAFNYGAPVSIREAASDNLYYRYFQKIDVKMYTEMIARRIIDSLIEFLDDHDIDTTALRNQAINANYINNFAGEGATFNNLQSPNFVKTAVSFGQNAVSRVMNGSGTWGGEGSAGSPSGGT